MKKIFKKFLSLIRNFFVTVGIMVTILYILLLIMLSRYTPTSTSSSVSEPKSPYVIVFDKKAELTSQVADPRSEFLESFFKSVQKIPLNAFKKMFEQAALDSKVKGVYLDISFLQGGYGDYLVLADFVKKYMESGKPLWLHHNSYNSASFILTSFATKSSLPPLGGIELSGPSFQLVYFAEAAKKLGIKFNVFRAGKYKSAFEPFVANEPSSATLEELVSVENSLKQNLINILSDNKNIDPSKARSWFKKSIFGSEESVTGGLVNQIIHGEDFKKEFIASLELRDKDLVSFDDFLTIKLNVDSPPKSGSDGLALIQAFGNIMMDTEDSRAKDVITFKDLNKKLHWASTQDNIKAVVLRINSPGGSALSSEIIWNQVRQLAEKKPVIVSMGDVAASGGYYIAAPATKIIAEPTTITGSIGVIGMIPSVAAFREKYGVSFHMVTQSDRKALLNLGEQPTAEDERVMGAIIDEVYNTFLDRVSHGRKKSVEEVHKLAQGRIYTGRQALEVGLVDKIGHFYDALQEAKIAAGFDPEKLYPLYIYKDDELSLFDCLNPKNFNRCLRKFGTELRAEFSSNLKDEIYNQVLPTTNQKFLNNLTKMFNQDEMVFAIWPGVVR